MNQPVKRYEVREAETAGCMIQHEGAMKDAVEMILKIPDGKGGLTSVRYIILADGAKLLAQMLVKAADAVDPRLHKGGTGKH